MKFVSIVSSVYIFSSGMSSYFCPQLFVPLTFSYVFSIGGYEVSSYIQGRLAK
ncbi:MAG: hypothetical protein LVQ63_07005 [Thermoplasmatales archaeon]|nr:hypothetical protein [Thermoplasmatales archaeon]